MAEKKLTINIKEDFTIQNIEEWYKINKEKILKHKEIVINLQNIDQIDITGIQVLYAIKNLKDKKITIKSNIEENLSGLLKRTSLSNIIN